MTERRSRDPGPCLAGWLAPQLFQRLLPWLDPEPEPEPEAEP
jgi:hypothetical protein